MAKVFGLEVEVITPKEAADMWPLMSASDLVGAVWLPGDGRTNPTDTTMALAKGAQQGGATIMEGDVVLSCADGGPDLLRVAGRDADRVRLAADADPRAPAATTWDSLIACAVLPRRSRSGAGDCATPLSRT